jgi:predicted DsbA family dithiol-disulfide isomerase
LKEEFDIDDEWLPLEIHPETPKNGVEISQRFPQASLKQMFSNLKNMGDKLGKEFNELTVLSNSKKLLEVGEYAKEQGKFETFNEQAFYSYFTEVKDIGDNRTILDIAEKSGLCKDDVEKVLKEERYKTVLQQVQEMAHEYGINSTPTFIIDDKYAIVGAQPLESFRKALLELEQKD